jgi:anti-anti-sigma regulatory factor
MSKKLMRVLPNDGFAVMHLGEMEIWDGADMALLRESLTRLIKADKQRSIGVDMTYVKYIPSGFFGMLFDWFETGVQIRLYAPQPNVRRMLWFNQFFEAAGQDCFELAPQAPARCGTTYSTNNHAERRSSRVEANKVVAQAGR